RILMLIWTEKRPLSTNGTVSDGMRATPSDGICAVLCRSWPLLNGRRSVRRDEGSKPADGAREEAQRRRGIMLALRVIVDGNGQAALSGSIKKAFHLGVDVELVAAAVTDVHVELTLAQRQPVDHFDRVLQADLDGGLRAAVIKIIENLLEPHGDDHIKAADDFVTVAVVGAPAPAGWIELAHVLAMAIEPAQLD